MNDESPGRRAPIGAPLAAALILLSACAPSVPKSYIPDDWPSWRKTTNVALDYPIPGHEDRYRVIRINDTGWEYAAGAAGGRREFPEGTIVVKEIYSSGKPASGEKPVTLTTMVKAPKDPSARGGWLWVVKDLATGKETVMTGTFCVTCHSNANEPHPYGDLNAGGEFRDFLFFIPPP